jgi:isopentenyldiphosphate isomerase/N-acetylglutamate synthase-like GNAT family acetyltransferase
MPEYFDVVNENDIVVDRQSGRDCVNRGLLHRAILVFLINERGEVYLQKRARNVMFYPGHWSASVTGHVSSGETYLEAAKREVKEELRIDCELRELGKFLTPKWKIGDMTEWEFIAAFEGSLSDTSGRITLSHETEEGRFLSPRDFRNWASKEPGTFTPETLLAMKYLPIAGHRSLNDFLIRSIRASDRIWVESFVKSRWGTEIVVAKGRVIRPAELDGFAAFKGKDPIGLLTYQIEGLDCEIVTIDSTVEGAGIGSALIEAVKKKAKAKGCKRLRLTTTNDNLGALRFYQKRDFRLIALYPNALEASRKLKPQISMKAANAIPIRDELELELELS